MIRDKLLEILNWEAVGMTTKEQLTKRQSDSLLSLFKEYIKEFEALRYCREECGGAWDLQDSILEGLEKENV